MRQQTATALAVLAMLLPFASSQAESGRIERREAGMRWIEDLDAAIREARARNIPLWVAYHKDN